MEIIKVALGARSYEIRIGDGLLDEAVSHLEPLTRSGRLLVVSDERVWVEQGERLRCGAKPINLVPILVPPGEGSKGWPGLTHVVDRLLAAGVERQDHIVAFGGGVIGDLAGFAAAIVNRGCNLVQISTSLLAQVDSSVGGKTAINVAAGKNLVGAFHQPSLVLIDPTCLDTLDSRQLRAGYAEIVKYGLIKDASLFHWLERDGHRLLAGEPEARAKGIAAAVAGKAEIVEQDERETRDIRALLNFGHTFGHALEAETGFSDQLLHGEAVALGCVLAFTLSAERGICPVDEVERTRRHFASVGLPTALGEIGLANRAQSLLAHIRIDKKREGGRVPLILTRGIGQAFVARDVELSELSAFLCRAA